MKVNKKQKIISALVIILAIAAMVISFTYKDGTESDISLGENNNEVINNTSEDLENTDSNFKPFDKAEYDRIMDLAGKAFNQKNYSGALTYYNQALKMEELDVIYGKMYMTYMVLKDYTNASLSLEKARNLNPSFNQYWIWTIEFKRDISKASYSELYKIYQEGETKVELTAKVNFVTFFARVSEEMGEKTKAIELWKKAIELNPPKASIYQAEVDRIQASR